MARLPIPGSDQGTWGEILNEYLSQSHAPGGSLKPGVVASTQREDGAVTQNKIADGSITTEKIEKLGAPGGLATLDDNAHLPEGQLPDGLHSAALNATIATVAGPVAKRAAGARGQFYNLTGSSMRAFRSAQARAAGSGATVTTLLKSNSIGQSVINAPFSANAQIRERLQRISLERQVVEEKLARTTERIEHGVSTILGYLDLLHEPGRLFEKADDQARRELLQALFERILVEESEGVDAQGQRTQPNEAIHSLEPLLGAADKAVKRNDPCKAAGVETSDSPNAPYSPLGLNNRVLVGRTGLEPVTDGL